MDVIASLTWMLFGFAIIVVLFLIMRRVVLWYFRLDQIADNLAYLANHFREQERAAQQPSPKTLPPMPPYEQMSLEERARRLREGQSGS